MLEYDTVMVKKADLENLISKVDRLQREFDEYRAISNIRNKIDALAKGNMLNAPAICKILNWSTRTFYRRVEAGEFPAVLDGARYKIEVDEFFKWYKENYLS